MISLRLAVFVAIILHHFPNHDVWLKRLCGANAEDVPTTKEKKTKSRIESVIEALRQVADVEKQLRENKGCDKVDLLNITFDERRWKKEALLTVQVANLMTSLWRSPGENGYPVAANDALLYDFVRSIVLFSPPVFGSVICFDNYLYKNYTRFCPYAFRDPGLNGSVHVIDIVSASEGYDYTTDHNAIWWHQPKSKARSFTPARVTSLYQTRFNTTATDLPRKRTFPHVTFENGTWTRPYFDCFGGKVWMVTYLAPFYNETDDFLGVVSIDVVLSDIDINQCDNQDSSESVDGEKNGIDYTPGDLMEFMGTHLCKKSTKCERITNEGFKRGSYICTCKRGYYFPDSRAPVKAFNGTAIELEHDRMLRGEPNAYEDDSFECIRCSVGCDECVDDSPCVYSLKVEIRLTLCVLNGFVMGVTIVFAVYVAINWKDKIFKASSPKFMEVILLGAMLMYSTLVVSYFEPNTISCISRPWLRHIGFALVYGPLALKTWRVALIFRVRSAQKLALSDGVLLKRLFLLVILYSSYLTVWTVMQPPSVETAMTSDDLKYQRCVENWFDLTVIFGDIVVLIWGMWLCYKIRNAPAAYNESKYISWAIYNAMFVTSFLMVVRVTTKGNSNPDLMYALDFLLIHMNCSIVLILMFIHKFLLVRQMQRTVNNAISSHNNMLVTEDEVVVDRAAYQQEELLRKENQALKEEVRRLGEKLAALKSRLMTDGNHPVHKASSRAGSVRRKSACAFTLPHKEPGTVLETKRHSLQLPPTLKNSTHDAGQSTAWTANPMPELNETHDVTYPQELDPAASLLHSVCVHSRKLSQQSEKS